MTGRSKRVAVATLVLALAFTACADGDTSTPAAPTRPTATSEESDGHDHDENAGACGKAQSEALDPQSGRHLLPGSPTPEYLTDPPTSGPHRPGSHPTGVLPDPIELPVQVALLEAGHVIIQHKGLDKADFDRVAALATEHVTVAPSTRLPAKVVATAWQVKLLCPQVDVPALKAFVTTYLEPGKVH